MDKSNLLIELGVEEIPAWMLEDASQQFADLLVRSLKDQRLSAEAEAVWFTPRRIVVSLSDVPIRQEDQRETVTGPPKSVAYNADGTPGRAAIAFAERNGVPISRIRIVRMPKGEYLSIVRTVRGEKTHKLLERLIPDCIRRIQFPKTMHWSPDQFRFARPIRWILALYNQKVVRFSIADVNSSRFTNGHRFMGKGRLRVASLDTLKSQLLENGVLVDPAERASRIEIGLQREADLAGGRLLADSDLLKTVVNLNEYPSVIRGSFEERFLALPKEILVTVMREHQKYFSVLGPDGRLMPAFLAVINLDPTQSDLIRLGHERVLKARLADGAFFWDTDRKRSLGDREDSLRSVLFQEKLGSYHDKTQRIVGLLPEVAAVTGQAELSQDLVCAGHLCKCDLVTEMVKEFTDLQGIVGGLYAQAEGYPEAVWRAVYEQYMPKSANSPSPDSRTGALLALADRLDTVCGCFSIGLIPSGSGDPFAVRRQANGILKIILDQRLSVSMEKLIRLSLSSFGEVREGTPRELMDFFQGRLRFVFEEMGFAYDFINATLAAGYDDPLDALERLRALQAMREETDFLSLASNFKRIINILAQAGGIHGLPDDAKFADPAERALWLRILDVRPEVEAARRNHDYGAALRALASMRGVVDEFFEKVLVMAEDEAIKKNRLALLSQVSLLLRSIADISQIVMERSV